MKHIMRSSPLLFVTLAVIVFASTLPAFACTVAAQGIPTYEIEPALSVCILAGPGSWTAYSGSIVDRIAGNLEDLGIQVFKYFSTGSWYEVDSRAFSPSKDAIGKTYAEGGFDVLLMGWSLNPEPNVYGFSHSSQWPPVGRNYYLWNNTVSDDLASKITSEMDPSVRQEYIKSWQTVAYEELPSFALYYDDGVLAVRSDFNSTPFELNYYPKWPGVEQWKFISSPLTSVTLAQTIDCVYYSPYHTKYVNYGTGYGPIFGELRGQGLLKRGLNATTMEPYMAYGNYTMSPDGRNWTFWIRPGIKFHNGEELDARDVVYTYRYVMTPNWSSSAYWTIRGILGSNASVYWAGESGTQGASMSYNRYEVHFDLPRSWAFFEQSIGGGSIFPASVLIDSSSGIPDLSAWNPNAGSTGAFHLTSFVIDGGSDYTYYARNGTLCVGSGPIGAGPYQWVGHDDLTHTVHLRKFSSYFNRAALESAGAYGIIDYYVKCIPDQGTAIAALMDNSVQVLDPLYNLYGSVDSFDPASSRIISFHGFKVIELGFNMQHPIWGTGLGTPVGQLDPSQAAEAGKHMRHAFEYLVPRVSIISDLLHGYAMTGLTTPVARSMPGFNFGISQRNGSATNAKSLAMDELRAAGYRIENSGFTIFVQFLLSPFFAAILAPTLLLLGVGLIRRRRRVNRPPQSRRLQVNRGDIRVAAGSPAQNRPISRPRVSHDGAVLSSATVIDARKGQQDQSKTAVRTGKCMVCNLEVDMNDSIVWCPFCGSLAHSVHMQEWLHVKDYCPICRHHIDERDLRVANSRD